MTEAEIEEALKGDYEYSDPTFKAPAHLVLLAGEDYHEGYGHYSRREVYLDPQDDTYVGVEGSGCSCDGADTAWAAPNLAEALKSFGEYHRRKLETELTEKGLLP